MTTRRWSRQAAVVAAGLALLAGACGGRDADDDTASDAGGGGAETGDTGGSGEGGTGGGGSNEGGTPSEAPGFDGTTISVGALTPTSGQVAVIGNPLTAGNVAYFDQLNAEGGVAGQYPVEVLIRDTAYAENQAIQEYNATRDEVVMYTQILGTPIINAVLGQLSADNIVGAPATLDAEWVREQNLLPIGGPYQVQMINGIDWFVTEGGGEGQAICALTQDDPYGEAGYEGVEFAAEELGLELGPRVTFPAGNQDFTTQISQLQSDGCEAVALVSTPADTARALGRAAGSGYAPTWLGQSPAWLKLLFESNPDLGTYATENLLILSEGPDWGDESVPGMVEMVAALEEFGGEQVPDTYFAFGYNQARAVHQVLEAAVANGDLSREGIVEAMNGLDELTFDGLSGDYPYGAPEDRDPPRQSTIFSVDLSTPTGLSAEAQDYTSEAAEAFTFDE